MTTTAPFDTHLPSIKRVNGAEVTPSAGPCGAFSAEAYLVLTPQPVLVDCGGPPTAAELRANLAALGIAPADLAAVIGTHYHHDHIGNLPALRDDAPHLAFRIHEADAAACVQGGSPGAPAGISRIDGRLRDGQRLRYGGATFEVLHAPGHTPGSSAIRVEVDGATALFVGDAVHGLYFPRPERDASADLDVWARSLDRLAAATFDYMYEGHVFPVHVLGNLSALAEAERADLYGLLEERMDERRRGIAGDVARRIMGAQATANRAKRLITPETWIMELAAQVRARLQGESGA
jgi:glyoxylase-like metal-dependent hydrolase (beta-lactamase superfamily II)